MSSKFPVALVLSQLLLGASVPLTQGSADTVLGVWYPAGSSERVDLPVGSTFRISINVTNIPEVIAYLLVLNYDTRYLDALGAMHEGTWACPAVEACELGQFWDVNDGLGRVEWEVFFPESHSPGGGTLLFIDFRVTAEGATLLDLDETVESDLIGVDFTRIPHITRDGEFNNTPFSLPIAEFTFKSLNSENQAQGRIVQGDTVEFNASSSYDDDEPQDGTSDPGGIVGYRWSFGDTSDDASIGTSNPIVTHVFRTGPAEVGGVRTLAGNFTVRLLAIDDDGQTSAKNQVVEVEPTPLPPPCPPENVVRVPTECATIRGALEWVTTGGRVEVSPGTYKENLLITRPVILLGSGREVTIIDGRSDGAALTIRAEDVSVSGFTIVNGELINPRLSNLIIEESTGITISDSFIGGVVSQEFPRFLPHGIRITNSSRVRLEHNIIQNRTIGIALERSPASIFRHNIIQNNVYSLDVSGDQNEDFLQDIDASNMANGKPVYYVVGAIGLNVPPELGYLALVNSRDAVIGPLSITAAGQGILLAGSSNISITGFNATRVREGISLFNSTSIVVENSVIRAESGIRLLHSNGNTILHNTLLLLSDRCCSPRLVGISILNSQMNRLIGNRIIDHFWGIVLDSSPANWLDGNIIEESQAVVSLGIDIEKSPRNVLRNNQIRDVGLGLVVNLNQYTRLLDDYIQDIDSSNILDGKPIYYLVNQHDYVVPSTAGYVAIVNSTDVTVQGVNLTNQVHGILVVSSAHVLVENAKVTEGAFGIFALDCLDLTVRNSHVSNSIGMIFESCNSGLILGNHISSISEGIHLYKSEKITIEGNFIVGYQREGISLTDSLGNTILRNSIIGVRHLGSDPFAGIKLARSASNLIVGNTIASNLLRYDADSNSTDNILYHNNFIENGIQTEGEGDIWDNGAGEGNFWSDYTGQDLDGDGMGDTQLPHSGFDSYPLMEPWMPDGLAAQFAGRAVWPEHRRFDISTDEDHHQTLFASAKNSGTDAVWVQGIFILTMSNGTTIELVSEPVWVEPGDVADLSVLFGPTPGVYRVAVELRFSSDAYLNWNSAGLRTSFFFVVP